MKIQVVGSCDDLSNSDKERFKAAGKALGKALAQSDDTIIVGVRNWDKKMSNTISKYIIQGAAEVPRKKDKKHNITFYCPCTPEPLDTTIDDPDTIHEFKNLYNNINLKVKHIPVISPKYGMNLISNLNDVDAVILVSGAEGTAHIGLSAHALNKPLLTVNKLDGTASEIAEDFLMLELVQVFQHDNTVDTSILDVHWYTEDEIKNDITNGTKGSDQEKNAEAIVNLTKKLIKIKALQKRSMQGALIASYILGPLMALLWIVVYLLAADNKINLSVAFFSLLFISSLAGSSLHTLIAQRDETTILTCQSIMIDTMLAFLLAFVLALLYLIGGISFTGEVIALDTESEHFQNIALSMSVLGLVAGVLLPVTDVLERLGKAPQ
jgi:hypothetical protein